MLFGSLDAPIDRLQDLFRDLSQEKGPFELHLLPFIEAYGGIRIVASCRGSMFQQGHGKPQGMRHVASPNGKVTSQ